MNGPVAAKAARILMSVFYQLVQREVETGKIGFKNQSHLVFEIYCVFPVDSLFSTLSHTWPSAGLGHSGFGLCDISLVDFFFFFNLSSPLFVTMPDLHKSWEQHSEYPE